MLDTSKQYDIIFVDIPVGKFQMDAEMSHKLNIMYSLQDEVMKIKTGFQFKEKKYYYTSGLLCLSSYLKEHNFTVGYVNYPKDNNKLKNMVMTSRYVGFSTVTVSIKMVLALVRKLKRINPEVQIILGGYHASYYASQLLEENPYIDGIVIGEGEKAVYKLLSGARKDTIEGFSCRMPNGEIYENKNVCTLEENEIPGCDFSLIEDDINDYNIYLGTMRGCVGQCNFCINHTYWGMPRYIPLEKIAENLQFLYEHLNDICLIHIIDNVFTLNVERLEELKDILFPMKDKFVLECDTLASLIDERKVCLLRDMNVIKIGLGFEDCSDRINKIARKGVNISDNIKAAQIIRKYGSDICVYAYWLIGLPGTNSESVEENIQTIQNLIANEVVHIISPKIFIPYPGTEFWKRSEKYDLHINSYDWSKYERVSPPYPYYLGTFTEKQLEEALEKIVDVCCIEYIKKWSICLTDLDKTNKVTWYGEIV